MDPSHAHYAGHWFPAEIISRTSTLCRFTLSFRDIEELMASRGVILDLRVDPSMVPEKSSWFSPMRSVVANPSEATSGLFDEVYLRINGKLHYLWRAVDQEGHVLDLLVHSRRDRQAANGSSANCSRVCATAHGY